MDRKKISAASRGKRKSGLHLCRASIFDIRRRISASPSIGRLLSSIRECLSRARSRRFDSSVELFARALRALSRGTHADFKRDEITLERRSRSLERNRRERERERCDYERPKVELEKKWCQIVNIKTYGHMHTCAHRALPVYTRDTQQTNRRIRAHTVQTRERHT